MCCYCVLLRTTVQQFVFLMLDVAAFMHDYTAVYTKYTMKLSNNTCDFTVVSSMCFYSFFIYVFVFCEIRMSSEIDLESAFACTHGWMTCAHGQK